MTPSVDQSVWTLDDSRWPVLVVRPTKRRFSDAELRTALRAYDTFLEARLEPYALIFDNRDVDAMPATQREMIADYNTRHADRQRAYCRGVAFVFSSAIVRGMMTAIFWIKRPETESRVFGDLDDAVMWCEARLWAGDTRPSRRAAP